MRKLVLLPIALAFATAPLAGQGIPFVTASAERWSVADDRGRSSSSYGGGAALGLRSDRGFVQLRAGWFPERENRPRLAVIGFEGGPRVAARRWSLDARLGWGGLHVDRTPPNYVIDCVEICLFSTVGVPQLRDGWSGYAAAGAGAGWRVTPWLDVGVRYRLTAALLGVNRGEILQGWNLAVTHAMR